METLKKRSEKHEKTVWCPDDGAAVHSLVRKGGAESGLVVYGGGEPELV